MGLAILPLSLIDVAIRVNHAALSVHVFGFHLASVHRAIGKLKVAQALPLLLIITLKLSLILSPGIHFRPEVLPNQVLLIDVIVCPFFRRHKRLLHFGSCEQRWLLQI